VIVGQRVGNASLPGIAGRTDSNRMLPAGQELLESGLPAIGGMSPAERTETPQAVVPAGVSPDVAMPNRRQTDGANGTATQAVLPAPSIGARGCAR